MTIMTATVDPRRLSSRQSWSTAHDSSVIRPSDKAVLLGRTKELLLLACAGASTLTFFWETGAVTRTPLPTMLASSWNQTASETGEVDSGRLKMLADLRHIIEKRAHTESAIPPTISSAAEEFIAYLPDGIALPWIAASSEGEIDFLWDREGVYVDLGFRGQVYSFYARIGTEEWFGDDCMPRQQLPAALITSLQKHGRVA